MLIVLLLIFHHGSGNPPYSELSAQWTFRVSFGIMAAMTLWLGMSLTSPPCLLFADNQLTSDTTRLPTPPLP
jgi:hypothetical protein